MNMCFTFPTHCIFYRNKIASLKMRSENNIERWICLLRFKAQYENIWKDGNQVFINFLNTCNEEKPSSTISFDYMQHHVTTLAFNDAESTL